MQGRRLAPAIDFVLSLDRASRMLLRNLELAFDCAEYLLRNETVGYDKVGGLDSLDSGYGQ